MRACVHVYFLRPAEERPVGGGGGPDAEAGAGGPEPPQDPRGHPDETAGQVPQLRQAGGPASVQVVHSEVPHGHRGHPAPAPPDPL